MKNYTPFELLEMSLALHRMLEDGLLKINKTKIQYLTGIFKGEIEPILVSEEDTKLAYIIKNHFKKYLMMVLSNDEIDIKCSSKKDHIYLYKILHDGYIVTKTGTMHCRNIQIIARTLELYNIDIHTETLKTCNAINGWLTPGLEFLDKSRKNRYTMDCEVITFNKCASYPGYNIYGMIDGYLVSWYSNFLFKKNSNIKIYFKIYGRQYNWDFRDIKETRLHSVIVS